MALTLVLAATRLCAPGYRTRATVGQPEHSMESAAMSRAATVGGAAATSNPGADSKLDARHRYKLLEDCRELVLDRLADIVAGALDRMAEELTDEALSLEKSDRKRTLLDAVLLVRQQRRAIELNFRRVFGAIFERRMFARPEAMPPPASADVSSDDLQLVSDDVISEKMDIDRLISKARSRLDPDEVLGIRARLGALLEREWFEEANHPASPEAIFEALRAAIDEVAPSQEIGHEVRGTLLYAFEPYVTRNLNSIYSVVNTRLKSQHVLPKIRQRLQRESNGTGPGITALANGGGAARRGKGTGAASADRGDWPDGVAGGRRPRLDEDGSTAVTMSASSLVSLQQALARAAVDQADLRGDAARMLSDPGMFGVADLPLEPVRQSVLQSLTAVQHEAPGEGALVPSGLLPLLVDKVRDTGTPLDQMTVELVAVVFDHIYADKSLADAVKSQLMRLQVVAVKAALLDRSFFARRQHPMRQLVDRVTQLGADPDADLAVDAPLVNGLARIVDQLIDEFDQDLAAFLSAIEGIDRLRQEEVARRAELLAAPLACAEREEALALAREAARCELSVRCDDATPGFVRAFLLRWWTQVIARSRTEPQNGPDTVEDQSLRIAELLIWSVAPKHPEEIGRLAKLLPRLIRAVNEGGRLVDVPDGDRAAFMQELLAAHSAVIDRAKRWQHGQPDPRPATLRLRADGTVKFARSRIEQQVDPATVAAGESVLNSFSRGDRIELADDVGLKAIYKLAWISPARKLFILSRYPKDTLSISAAEFAALVFSERARRVEEPKAVDEAIGELTRESAVAPGSHGQVALQFGRPSAPTPR
jgi:hypothetical protein